MHRRGPQSAAVSGPREPSALLAQLGEAVLAREKAGIDTPAEFLAHVSPLGWEHINLSGEYRWLGIASQGRRKRLP